MRINRIDTFKWAVQVKVGAVYKAKRSILHADVRVRGMAPIDEC